MLRASKKLRDSWFRDGNGSGDKGYEHCVAYVREHLTSDSSFTDDQERQINEDLDVTARDAQRPPVSRARRSPAGASVSAADRSVGPQPPAQSPGAGDRTLHQLLGVHLTQLLPARQVAHAACRRAAPGRRALSAPVALGVPSRSLARARRHRQPRADPGSGVGLAHEVAVAADRRDPLCTTPTSTAVEIGASRGISLIFDDARTSVVGTLELARR